MGPWDDVQRDPPTLGWTLVGHVDVLFICWRPRYVGGERVFEPSSVCYLLLRE